jgi:hypothetical protein
MTYFPEVTKPIAYEGPASDNPLAFKHYDAARKVRGKTMAQHLKFAVAYWHTFKGTGGDPFGGPVYDRPWDAGSDPLDAAYRTLEAAFEFFTKLGVNYYCFHDRDIAPEGDTIAESNRNLAEIVAQAKALPEGHRHQAALGHREPLQPPALLPRRRDQSRPARLRQRRRAGAPRASTPPSNSAAPATCSGAAAKATSP